MSSQENIISESTDKIPIAFGMAEADDVYIISLWENDDGLYMLFHVMEGYDVLDKPVSRCTYIPSGYDGTWNRRAVVTRMCELVATRTVSPYELRDGIITTEDLCDVELKEVIYGTHPLGSSERMCC